jgi:hypothetical protein
VSVDEVAAGVLLAGDVVRLDGPQAHRVERVVLGDGRVVVELRPVGLDVSNAVRVTLPVDRLVERLGTVGGLSREATSLRDLGDRVVTINACRRSCRQVAGSVAQVEPSARAGVCPAAVEALSGRERRATTALAPPSFAVSALPAGTDVLTSPGGCLQPGWPDPGWLIQVE